MAAAAAASSSAGTPEEIAAAYASIVCRRHPMEDYEIARKKLGKGSFGTVFKGVDKKTGLKVALKFSHNHLQAKAMDGARAEAVMMQMVSRCLPTQLTRLQNKTIFASSGG
jgi:hypothetical protein